MWLNMLFFELLLTFVVCQFGVFLLSLRIRLLDFIRKRSCVRSLKVGGIIYAYFEMNL